MKSWVFIFSKFTPEALLLESGLLFFLCLTYSAFWVLRKRKWGVLEEAELPPEPLREYLNSMLGETENLKAQLFGFTVSTEASLAPARRITRPTAAASESHTPGATGSGPGNEALLQQVEELEAKLTAQTQALESANAEKAKLLESASAASVTGGGGAAVGASTPKDLAEMAALQQKLAELEAKLFEYSVIEDDLANLKRFQQENQQLKAQLAALNGSPAASGTPPAAAAPQPAAPAPTPPPAETAPAAPLPSAGAEAAPAAAAPGGTEAPAAIGETPPGEKELASEFEKMFS